MALRKQRRNRETPLQILARLRQEASAEIDRLISFLDASDDYAITELEDCVDDSPCDEDEMECNLGWTSTGAHGSSWLEDLEDEHDGCEPDDEGDDNPDDEPSLGWPERLVQGMSLGASDDRELQ